MASLMEDLPKEIKRLEEIHGSENRYVIMLKEQLRAMKETQGKSLKEVFVVSVKSRDLSDTSSPLTKPKKKRSPTKKSA